MLQLSDEEFNSILSDAIDNIPEKYFSRIKNVAFVVEDDPSPHQRAKLHLHEGMTLFGLYEGIPLTQRGAGYNLVVPDKITIFKNPILHFSNTPADVKEQIRHTVWHEVAHYFGLDHDRIFKLDGSK